MRVINASVSEIQEQDILKKIELCGRICYKSENKITETSCVDFVKMLINRQHLAMTEHAPLVLAVTQRMAVGILKLGHGTFLNVTMNTQEDRYLVSGSVRAWHTLFVNSDPHGLVDDVISRCESYMQMSLGKDLYSLLFPNAHKHAADKNYLLTQEDVLNLPNLRPEEAMAHLYLTAHFICDRGVSHELVRHRPASFAQESTRYCNYARDTFGKEITLIDPEFTGPAHVKWLKAMTLVEQTYFALLSDGLPPQEARGVLPTDLKTEVVMTCNLREWQHVINLRYYGVTGAPHPHMVKVMTIWYELVKAKEGYKEWIK